MSKEQTAVDIAFKAADKFAVRVCAADKRERYSRVVEAYLAGDKNGYARAKTEQVILSDRQVDRLCAAAINQPMNVDRAIVRRQMENILNKCDKQEGLTRASPPRSRAIPAESHSVKKVGK